MNINRKTASDPINRGFLDQQTFGDRALQADILGLFIQQAATLRELLARGRDGPGIAAQLHRFKGSARAVGAESAAAEAERLETHLGDSRGEGLDISQTDALDLAIVEASRFAASLRSGIG